MLCVVHRIDNPENTYLRKVHRDVHLVHLAKYRDRILLAGPYMDPQNGIDRGSMFLMEVESLQEAKDFRAQEGLHSMAHRKHVKALIAQTPALQSALDRAIALYDELYETETLKYHLAYTGGLESIFTPSFKLMLDHREHLFNGDARVASLLLWHFCEEIEHRSSGLMVYDHVFGNYWYRIHEKNRSKL